MPAQHSTCKSFLIAVLSRTISRRDLARLVQQSRAIIEAHLHSSRASILTLCFHQGLTTSDLAYDCIAEAFARNDENRYPILENFAGSLATPIETAHQSEVFYAFKSFLVRIAEAQLARLFAQNDPVGARIHRNIRECLRTSPLFASARDFRGLVVRPAGQDPLDELEEFPPDELERAFFADARSGGDTPELLRILHRILAGQSRYRRSLTVLAVTQLFKRVYRPSGVVGDETEDLSHSHLTDFEIDRLCAEVEVSVKEKIYLTYLSRRKLSRVEAESVFRAFRDMIADWKEDAEQEQGLYGYLQRHLSVSSDVYETSYRTKMEYLLRLAREEFKMRLIVEL